MDPIQSNQTNRVDYESPLEDLFKSLTIFAASMGVIALGFILVALFYWVVGWMNGENTRGWTEPIPKLFVFLVVSMLLSAFFGFIRSRIDIYYYLDHGRRQLLLRRKVLFFRSETVVANFQDLHCLAVAGKFVSKSQGTGAPVYQYWSTALWLITKKGKKIRISDYTEHRHWTPEKSTLPKKLGLNLISSPSADHALKIRRGPKGLELTFGPDTAGCTGCLWVIGLALAAYGLFALVDWLKSP